VNVAALSKNITPPRAARQRKLAFPGRKGDYGRGESSTSRTRLPIRFQSFGSTMTRYYPNGAHGGFRQLTGGMLTPAVRWLLIATTVAYLLQLILDRIFAGGFTEIFALSAWGVGDGYIWEFVTYMFLHGHPLHLLVNLLVLFFLGPETERAVGSQQFCILYFLSGILAGLGWLLISPAHHLCVGASGAIFGILGAFAALFPHRQITLLLFFVLPLTMKAWVLVAGLVFFELLMLIGQPGGTVAHAVHLAGAVAGYIYSRTVFRGAPPAWPRWRMRRRPRLRIIRGPGPDAPRSTQAEVDRILEKIATQGMSSLTRQERETLEKMSNDLRSR